MKILIIEDEELAAEGLVRLLKRWEEPVEVLAQLDSVKSAVAWFQHNSAPDLAFFDIQLADGLSFSIFEQCKVTCPLIFTTAYDAYALRAFKVNSIDYLLKPYEWEDLHLALTKWKNLRGTALPDSDLLRQMLQGMGQQLQTPAYKTRFMVRSGDQLMSLAASEIAYFYSENKIVFLQKQGGRKYMVDYTLEQLEDLLDPSQFFRLNRQYIATVEAIKSVASYSNSRLKVLLKEPPNQEDLLISREKVEGFKDWFGG
jgi:DNA-binding LytR/AlgR family response regulator